MPAIAINIDDKKPSNKVKKFPEMPAGQSMDKEDVAPDTPEPEPCTNFQNGLSPAEEKHM
jgi:hypothetical protein